MDTVAFCLMAFIALSGIGGLVYSMVAVLRLIVRMGNQLTANSGHQLERIKYEAGAEAVAGYVRSVAPHNNGYAPNEPVPDMVIPNRG